MLMLSQFKNEPNVFFTLKDRRSADRFSCLMISVMLTVSTGGSCIKHRTRSFMHGRCLQNFADASWCIRFARLQQTVSSPGNPRRSMVEAARSIQLYLLTGLMAMDGALSTISKTGVYRCLQGGRSVTRQCGGICWFKTGSGLKLLQLWWYGMIPA